MRCPSTKRHDWRQRNEYETSSANPANPLAVKKRKHRVRRTKPKLNKCNESEPIYSTVTTEAKCQNAGVLRF